MASLRELAASYEPPRTKNIADLEKVPVELEIFEGEGKDSNGELFTYKYAVIDNEHYRIAGSIIGGLKALLQKMPNLTHFSVLKSGSGMNTKYQVIPYIEQQVSQSVPSSVGVESVK